VPLSGGYDSRLIGVSLRAALTAGDSLRHEMRVAGVGPSLVVRLAIGAALHGAAVVDAVDIDPAAVESTLANAEVNLKGVEAQLNTGLPDLVGEAQSAYPVVLANILATPLKLLSPLLSGHVAPGGHLVMAGILARQEDELKAAYGAVGLQLSVADEDDGWILMTAQRDKNDQGIPLKG